EHDRRWRSLGKIGLAAHGQHHVGISAVTHGNLQSAAHAARNGSEVEGDDGEDACIEGGRRQHVRLSCGSIEWSELHDRSTMIAAHPKSHRRAKRMKLSRRVCSYSASKPISSINECEPPGQASRKGS